MLRCILESLLGLVFHTVLMRKFYQRKDFSLSNGRFSNFLFPNVFWVFPNTPEKIWGWCGVCMFEESGRNSLALALLCGGTNVPNARNTHTRSPPQNWTESLEREKEREREFLQATATLPPHPSILPWCCTKYPGEHSQVKPTSPCSPTQVSVAQTRSAFSFIIGSWMGELLLLAQEEVFTSSPSEETVKQILDAEVSELI